MSLKNTNNESFIFLGFFEAGIFLRYILIVSEIVINLHFLKRIAMMLINSLCNSTINDNFSWDISLNILGFKGFLLQKIPGLLYVH